MGNKLITEKDEWCGRNEYVVRCKKCNIRHYKSSIELILFEKLGYYLCYSCIEQMGNIKIVEEKQ